MKKRILKIVGVIVCIIAILVIVVNVYSAVLRKKFSEMPIQERMDCVYEKIEHGQGDCFYILAGDGSFSYKNYSGDFKEESKYVNASVTKMYTATIIFQLMQEGRIRLSDSITMYLPQDELAGIHQYKGVDYTDKITINHLLCQTSGLPDFFTDKIRNEKTYMDILIEQGDYSYSFYDALDRTRQLEAKFIPGKENKAYYSDLNYHLLSEIIETVTKKSLADNYNERIMEPLGLKNTYLMEEGMQSGVVPIYYNGRSYNPEKYLISDRGAGGIITTLDESMTFLQAFMQGKLFDIEKLEDWDTFYSIQFFPMKYGMGMMKCSLPLNDFAIGHSGSAGSLAYYFPEKDIYIVGTTNDLDEAGSIQKMYQLIQFISL